MKKTLRPISLLLALIMLFLTLLIPVQAKVSYNDIKNETTEDLKAQLAEFDSIKKELKEQLKAAESLQATAKEKRSIYVTLQAIYNDEISILQAQLEESQIALDTVNAEIAALSTEYEHIYAQLQTVIRMTYEGEDASYISLILGASSISDLFSRIERANALITYNKRLMNQLKETQEAADLKAAELKEKSKEQAEALSVVEAKQAEIDAWNAENEKELLEIEAELDKIVSDYEEYDNQSDVIRDEFQDMVDELIKKEEERIKNEEEKRRQEAIAAANRKKGYLWPLPSSYSRLTSYFNEKRTISALGYVNKIHYGIDIPAPRGTPIYAIKAGRVLAAKYSAGYGYYVMIDHGDGITSLYAHCSKLLVSEGAIVERGATIALVGTTGNSTGNHLHLEMRVNGTRKDPLDYVKIS